jgi:hypothetical protein
MSVSPAFIPVPDVLQLQEGAAGQTVATIPLLSVAMKFPVTPTPSPEVAAKVALSAVPSPPNWAQLVESFAPRPLGVVTKVKVANAGAQARVVQRTALKIEVIGVPVRSFEGSPPK